MQPIAGRGVVRENRRRPTPDQASGSCPLGFTHIRGTKADGSGFQLWRKTIRKRLHVKIRATKEELRRHVHASIAEQGRWLGTVMRGYFA